MMGPPKPEDQGHMLDFMLKPLGLGGLPNAGKWAAGIGGPLLLMLLLSRLFKQGSYTPKQIKQASDLLDRMSEQQKMALVLTSRSSRIGKTKKPQVDKYPEGHQYQGSQTKTAMARCLGSLAATSLLTKLANFGDTNKYQRRPRTSSVVGRPRPLPQAPTGSSLSQPGPAAFASKIASTNSPVFSMCIERRMITGYLRPKDKEGADKKGTRGKSESSKQAALDPALANALGLGGIGAAGMGTLGVLSGLASPATSDDDEVDPETLEMKRKQPQSSRLSRALGGGLRGAAMGAGLGGLLGGLGTEAVRYLPNLQHRITHSKEIPAPDYKDSSQLSNWPHNARAGLSTGMQHVGRLFDKGKNHIWNQMSRQDQHAEMQKHVPLVYDNPIANTVQKLFSPPKP